MTMTEHKCGKLTTTILEDRKWSLFSKKGKMLLHKGNQTGFRSLIKSPHKPASAIWMDPFTSWNILEQEYGHLSLKVKDMLFKTAI